ncbi:unnamed protein product [Clonostachys rosea]|uniref:BZIP domain-containing protein n=1 Tax=Bionectria ochroleuca TaxID=29856 RepID=A0ABY6UE11_BIOOC|nr:unnamed protein product [Clonostachys rosea]
MDQQSESQKEVELRRKRARDRKAQQAMRDRTKWTINSLSEQVSVLTATIDERACELQSLRLTVSQLEADNAHLRTQNAALQLSLLGRVVDGNETLTVSSGLSPISVESVHVPPWELSPRNTPAGCLADDILQDFINQTRTTGLASTPRTAEDQGSASTWKPNLCSLLDRNHRPDDKISNVVAGIVNAYTEIEDLPRQVAVFVNLAHLLNWMVLLDRDSWELLPDWLRPVPIQAATPHAAWIDRIPWPRAREYLIIHPEITLDDFVVPYSSSFSLNWPYDPTSVLLPPVTRNDQITEITVNPVFQEHMKQISNWTIGEAFRKRFPDMSRLIDMDLGQPSAPSTPSTHGASASH